MPKRTVYAYTVLLYIYMKQDAPIPGPVFLYVPLLSCKSPCILFSRHLSADMHDGRKTSCKVRNHQLDRIHDFHPPLTFYDNFIII